MRLVPVYELNPDGDCTCDEGCPPKDRGKHPRLGNWRHAASSDWTRVGAWHGIWPDCNWAWVLDNHFVLDSDPRNGGFGPDTFALEWEENVGFELPPTRLQGTGGGGVHAVFTQPGIGSVRSGKLWLQGRALTGLEVKGNGGYVLVEPSNHVTGGSYRWLNFALPADPGPDLLQLRSRRDPDRAGLTAEHSSASDQPSTFDGERFDWDEALTPGAIPAGDQQPTLYRAAASCRARNLPDSAAVEQLTRVVRGFTNTDPDDPWADHHAEEMWERVKTELPAGSEVELTQVQRNFRPQLTLIRGEGANGADPPDDVPDPEERPPPRPEDIGEFTAPAPTEPVTVARWLVTRLWQHDDGIGLVFWRENFLRWETGAWQVVEDQAIRTEIYERLEPAIYLNTDGEPTPWKPTSNRVNQVVDALKAITYLDGRVESGTWLSPVLGDPDPAEVIAVRNGLLHRPTRELRPHTPRLFNLSCVPFNFDPAARCPRWDGFLNELWLGGGMSREMALAMDPTACDSMNVLEEYFGYVLGGRTDIHKILLLIGPPRSGRGTILRVLTSLVGADNVAAPTLASLGTNFGLQPLIGKKLVTFTDARIEGKTSTIVERLLSLSGEDAITVDRKNRSQWTGRLGVRMVLVSNELPELHDASGAVAERFLLLPPLTRSWLGREDIGLTDHLLQELPGILNRALDGLDRIAVRGRFVEPAAAADARERLRGLASPTLTFVEDCLEIGDPTWEVEASDVFNAWKIWCQETNEIPGGQAAFGKSLHAVIPTLRKAKPRVNGVQRVHYVGVRMRPDVPIGPILNYRP